MGNCTSSRYLEEESKTYLFHVTNLDLNRKPVRKGTLRVTPSGLIYEGQDKKDQVVWVWQHVRGISYDGRVIKKIGLQWQS